MTDQEKVYTIEEFEEFIARPENSDRLFELIHGEIIEKVPTQEHGFICAKLIIRLGGFLEANKSGRLGPEIRHQIPGDDDDGRLPDISIYLDMNAPVIKEGAVPHMPDIAIEVKSPNDSYARMRNKAIYYLENGTLLVWLVYPEKRLVEVHHGVDDFEIFDSSDTLDGGSILPGFKLAVKDLFEGL